jgi:cob(I)alamin adenosyltransferase
MTDPEAIPTEHHKPPLRHADSVVVVNTGDGKGKSTAAFGVLLRGVARGWQVGEEQVARDRLGVDWFAIGEGFTWDSTDLTEDAAVARRAWEHARSMLLAGEHRLLILDEITYPMTWGWISTDEVVAALRDRPAKVNVVLTGRDAPAELVAVADTVTEMRKVKHAYDTGVLAKKGIDY